MTLLTPANANAGAPRFEIESFRDYANRELAAAPPWEAGVCFNPICGRRFDPARDWQIFCGPQCAAVGKAEMRMIGHKLALPSLVHRMGKYITDDPAILERTRAARRFVTRVQSLWLEDRRARMEARHG